MMMREQMAFADSPWASGGSVVCLMALLLALGAGSASGSVAMRVVGAGDAKAPNVLDNAGFEEGQGDAATRWRACRKGFRCETGRGREGGRGVVCESGDTAEQYGASQTVVLNQETTWPIVVRGWSRAENVSGTPDSGYSLYVDLEYSDGTPLWGQTVSFSTGTHDWQQRELLIVPDRPIASLNLHCLFRGHTGKVWFDDVELRPAAEPGMSLLVLDGVVMTPVPISGPVALGMPLRTGDGLSIGYHSETAQVTLLRIGERRLDAADVPSGFMARDVATDSDWHAFRDGVCRALSLQLAMTGTAKPTHFEFNGALFDTSGRDRAVTLMFALPLDARGWHWGESIRATRQIGTAGEYANNVRIGTGATGTMAQYPFSCIADNTSGLALGIDMTAPAQYRLAYNAGTRQYFIAYDFGLTPETSHLPGGAHFRFVLYRIDPAWGFRSAAKRYYEIFPHFFQCRSKRQGIWMPFTDVSTVEGWQDFGFRYHEGINNVPFDDSADILSFRYTEPCTFWMRMEKDVPRTYEAALAELHRHAAGDEPRKRRMAQAVLASGSHDEEGRFQMLFRDTPWCDGAVFSLSPLPDIPGEWTDAKVAWNDDVKERHYGPGAKGEQDGEYLDSLEAYVTANENFRREHFRAATLPLTFTTAGKRPVIHKSLAIYEFVRWISEDVHRMGKLMMANSVPSRFSFLCGHLDVMGTETNWMRGGKWQPMAHGSMALRRTMCYQKPYLLLMNTDYDALEPFVERYFQRSLFYGMFPSMFSPVASSSTDAYWRTPRWYNRDRELFKRYIPIIKRVAEAGWEPVTHGTTDNDDFLVERFGPDDEGRVYFTVMNDGEAAARGTVLIEAEALKLSDKATGRELVSGQAIALKAADNTLECEVELEAEEVVALEVSR